jgi:SAM-dependent methyltransferase
VDRYYIENFLLRVHAAAIRGRVLEVGDNTYTLRYAAHQVTQSDVLHVNDTNPNATIVGDLSRADHIPSGAFDCIILTQTLQFIYDAKAALATLHRILKPGGVLLLTVPGITHIGDQNWKESWYWMFTVRSVQMLFGEAFPSDNIQITSHGNVLAATGLLYGMGASELTPEELDANDTNYPVIITVSARKPE